MEDLLIGGISRRANAAGTRQIAKILDVSENHVGRFPIVRISVVLSTALGSYVRRETSIDHDILLAGVVINTKSPDDEKAMAKVKLMR